MLCYGLRLKKQDFVWKAYNEQCSPLPSLEKASCLAGNQPDRKLDINNATHAQQPQYVQTHFSKTTQQNCSKFVMVLIDCTVAFLLAKARYQAKIRPLWLMHCNGGTHGKPGCWTGVPELSSFACFHVMSSNITVFSESAAIRCTGDFVQRTLFQC